MRNFTLMLVPWLLIPALQAADGPTGDVAAGKTAWEERRCRRCHGEMGEGGFAPDLAGRAISFAQFKQALRKPWGIMPMFNETYTNDQTIADLQTFLMTLPKVDAPGPDIIDIKNI